MTSRSPSLVVVDAVAEAEGVHPADLDCKLAEYVDPTALDRLFDARNGRSSAVVAFSYCGYEVTVRDDGNLDVEVELDR